MSNMKNGFSTLNRWLGKKNKDKATPNGKLSKSSTNLSLSVSSTNINETSQLEYNRITPLPVATSNAPFEQTFRITVLLPKEQLYVARLGARVPLSKLLELVCENKQLDAEKYEFRNPVDPSQIYSCDLTIGAVGLSEVRLCHKSEAYDNFNADEVIKLHRTSIIRDSLSSSEFSSRHSKHTTKTASPYSSSNSLNSMDSTGMNYTRTPVAPPPAMAANNSSTINNNNTVSNNNNAGSKMTAPPRKKRAAPRPPSQTAIPERAPLVLANGKATKTTTEDQTAAAAVTARDQNQDQALIGRRKDFCSSTPNLASSTLLSATGSSSSMDCNGNSNSNSSNKSHDLVEGEGEGPETEEVEPRSRLNVEERNARNLYRGNSVQSLASPEQMQAQMSSRFPEPSPRKRILQIKKKSAAPAPPPRGSSAVSCANSSADDVDEDDGVALAEDDSGSLGSHRAMSPQGSPEVEVGAEVPRPTAREAPLQTSTPEARTPASGPKPVPRITTTTTLVNAAETRPMEEGRNNNSNNVSKVLLNRTPTPEPRSLSTEPPDLAPPHPEDAALTNVLLLNGAIERDRDQDQDNEDDDNVSKQADSGIGEPVPSPIPDSLPALLLGEGAASSLDGKSSTFESSSDDDDMVKVYNFKLGKTLVKPLAEGQQEVGVGVAVAQLDSEDTEGASLASASAASATSETSWNFQIPISPPPNFADQGSGNGSGSGISSKAPDAPITPKIKERPVLNFSAVADDGDAVDDADVEAVAGDGAAPSASRSRGVPSPLPPTGGSGAATPMSDIVGELSTLISENRMDSLIRRSDREGSTEIEAAKPNTLSNFSISSLQETEKAAEKALEQALQKTLEKTLEKASEEALDKALEKTSEQTPEKTAEKEIEIVERSAETIAMKPALEPEVTRTTTAPSSPESSPEEEKLYRKRGSITNGTNFLKQRRSVKRADSFHSTVSSTNHYHNSFSNSTQSQPQSRSLCQNGLGGQAENGLNSRSSSHLSLTKLEQSQSGVVNGVNGANLQRRRSSSELSIGESPSLQSLEVIKTILNSRKNSLNASGSGSDGESAARPQLDVERLESKLRGVTKEVATSDVVNKEVAKKEAPMKAELTSSAEPTPEDETTTTVETGGRSPEKPAVPAKELPKVYRYSGPPSINLSTWSERPKVQVAIKNEGDYIFGGKGASGQSHAAVTSANMEIRTPQTPKPTPTPTPTSMPTQTATTTNTMPRSYRASMPAEDFRSLRLRTETRGVSPTPTPTATATPPPTPVEPKPVGPTVRMGIPEQQEFKVPITVKPLKDVAVEGVAEQPTKPPTAPKKPTTTATTTTSISLVNGANDEAAAVTASAPRPQTSTSAFLATLPRVNNGKRFSTTPRTEPSTETVASAPFGQNTLRKTGLKEKILAKEEAEQAKRNGTVQVTCNSNRSNSTPSPTPPPATTTTKTTIPTNSTASAFNTAHKSPLPVATPTIGKMLQSAKLELKLQKSTSVYVNHSGPVTPTSTPLATPKTAPIVGGAPPPPPLSMLKPLTAVAPPGSGRATTPQSPDPRDQLLEAIRNFKRDELKRS